MNDIKSYWNVGAFTTLAQQTKRGNLTDAGGNVALNWTRVPVIIAGPDGEIEFEVEYNEVLDCVQLVPKFAGEIEVAGQVVGYAK